jgi:hypothetical protein
MVYVSKLKINYKSRGVNTTKQTEESNPDKYLEKKNRKHTLPSISPTEIALFNLLMVD